MLTCLQVKTLPPTVKIRMRRRHECNVVLIPSNQRGPNGMSANGNIFVEIGTCMCISQDGEWKAMYIRIKQQILHGINSPGTGCRRDKFDCVMRGSACDVVDIYWVTESMSTCVNG